MEQKLREDVLCKVTKGKIEHTLGCIKAAKELAIRWGANVDDCEKAALIHDITKHFSENEQFTLCEKYDIIVDNVEKRNFKLLHAKTAAEIARHEYGMNDDICLGIKYHTTLRCDMTLIEKIVYLADYIEENRTFDEVHKARELAFTDINKALIYCLDTVILEIVKKGNLLHFDTIEARNYLCELC